MDEDHIDFSTCHSSPCDILSACYVAKFFQVHLPVETLSVFRVTPIRILMESRDFERHAQNSNVNFYRSPQAEYILSARFVGKIIL